MASRFLILEHNFILSGNNWWLGLGNEGFHGNFMINLPGI
jgi:hypothetical protein